MSLIPDATGPAGGFLTDSDITEVLPLIFREGSYAPDHVRHASYQLRLDEVKLCSRSESAHEGTQVFEEFQQLRWREENGEEFVDIKRRQVALLYSREFFTFPHNALGFTVGRGLLFGLGLTPENTYVDPGFSGKLYITIVNNNENTIRLCRGMSISRLFIFKLAQQVRVPYVAGADIGIEQQLRQVSVRTFWSEHQLKKVRDRDVLDAIRNGCSVGDLLFHIIQRRIRSNTIHTAWLVFTSIVLVLLVLKPYILLLIEKVSLPPWVPKELASIILTLVLGASGVVIEHYVTKLLLSRKRRQVGIMKATRDQLRGIFQPSKVLLAIVAKPTEGDYNILPLCFHTWCSYSPSLYAVAIQQLNYSSELFAHAAEFVLAVPGERMLDVVTFCGTHTGRDCDKGAACRIQWAESDNIRTPRLSDAIANMEVLIRTKMKTGDHLMVVGEVVSISLEEARGQRPLLAVGPGPSGYDVLWRHGIHTVGVAR